VKCFLSKIYFESKPLSGDSTYKSVVDPVRFGSGSNQIFGPTGYLVRPDIRPDFDSVFKCLVKFAFQLSKGEYELGRNQTVTSV
jgi:hypothetical protein